jgi:hypothetical protein
MNDDFKFQIPIRNKDGEIIKYTIVDEDDYDRVSKYTWSLSDYYAKGIVDGRKIFLHHFILQKPSNQNVIDHKNGDKLDNRKCNLHEVSKSFNCHNRTKNPDIETSSQYKGVSWNKKAKKYSALSGTQFLGYFDEEEAAKIYDTFTYIKFGEFANNNKLVNYEDVKNIDITSLIPKKEKKYNLPKYIRTKRNKYFVERLYKSKYYMSPQRETLKETIIDLIEINHEINKLKLMEQVFYHLKPIQRNQDGIAIIKIKDTEVLVDDNVWHKFSKAGWNINKDGYIQGNRNFGKMHRYLMEAKEGEIVDHINNIRHDNRISNLRIVSFVDNSHNKVKKANTSSKYFGVSFFKRDKKWRVNISHNHKKYHLGSFENEEDAAKAYNDKAIELYGDSANLNEI